MNIDTTRFLDTSQLPSGVLTRTEVVEKLKDYVSKFETQEKAADSLEISRVFLWRILNDRKPPSSKVLRKLGFEKETRQAEFYYAA